MTEPDVSVGLEVKGEVDVEYGDQRLRVAHHFGIDPSEVTGAHMDHYEEQNG